MMRMMTQMLTRGQQRGKREEEEEEEEEEEQGKEVAFESQSFEGTSGDKSKVEQKNRNQRNNERTTTTITTTTTTTTTTAMTTSPRWSPPYAFYKHHRYSMRPKRIEEYEPGKSSIAMLEPLTALSSNYQVDKPGDLCKYEENISNKEYLIQRPTCPGKVNTSIISGHQLYLDVQNGGDIPLAGLHIKDLSKRFTMSVRRHSSSCIFYPRSASEPRPSARKLARPCPSSPFNRNECSTPTANISLSELLSRAGHEVRSRRAVDEINAARKKEMEIVLKSVKEKKKLIEEEDNKARRHSDKYFCSSPICVDRYNFEDETSSFTGEGRQRDLKKTRPRALVLHNFQAKNARELTLRKGEVVYIWRSIDCNWLEVEHHGEVGLFPASYLELLKSGGSTEIEERTTRVKFNFSARLPREMSVRKGDRVKMLGKIDKNWILVERRDRIGLVPESYLETRIQSSCDPDDGRTTSDVHSTADSTNVSESLSTESLAKCRSTTPGSVSSNSNNNNNNNNRPRVDKLASDFPKTKPLENLNSPQEASRSASEMLPFVECVAVQSYRPQEVDELLLTRGDVIRVTEIFNDGWFVGISARTKQCGTFPGVCVRKL